MSGFVVFQGEEAADRFSGSLRQTRSIRHEFVTRSAGFPYFVFSNLEEEEVRALAVIAEELGGHLQASTKYAPASS